MFETSQKNNPMRTSVLAILAFLLFSTPSHATELGAYEGAGCTGVGKLSNFSDWLGRDVERGLDFVSYTSWDDFLHASRWSLQCWQKVKIPMTFSVPMLPKQPQTSLKDGANGLYDAHFYTLAEDLIKYGQQDAVIRIGWEFNGGWYPWAAKQDPESWKKYWRRIVTVMRSVPGAAFRFDWCPANGWQQIEQDKLYPGDDVVDIIGTDIYNQTWAAMANTPEKRWWVLSEGPYGLSWLAHFAEDHHKPISLPEWGTGTRPDGHGGGDDPLFIRNMAKWIATHPVAYQMYWDYHASDYDAKLSDGKQPLSEKAFIEAFGHRGQK